MEAVTVVRALFAAVTVRDVDAACALVDPEAEFWPEGTAGYVGRQEPYRGHDGIQQYFDDLAHTWERLEFEPDDLRAAGEGVIAFGHVRGIRRDGEPVSAPVIWTFKVRDGRLRFGRVVTTIAHAERALRQ